MRHATSDAVRLSLLLLTIKGAVPRTDLPAGCSRFSSVKRHGDTAAVKAREMVDRGRTITRKEEVENEMAATDEQVSRFYRPRQIDRGVIASGRVSARLQSEIIRTTPRIGVSSPFRTFAK